MARKQDRENTVLEALKLRKKLNTEEVTEMLAISDSSARRLFIELERTGKVVRTYGGIHLVSSQGPVYSFEELEGKNLIAKQQIAECAADIICDDDFVYFDGGTTLLQLAIAVKHRLQNNELHRIRVITNSYANLQVLHDCCNVILIGGEYRERRKDFAGYAAERFVQSFSYKKAFLGVDGLDMNEGFMATDTDTAKLNEVVIKRSDESYVLLDSSKFGLRSFVSYAGVSEIKAIITDNNIDSAVEAQCSQANLHVLVCKSS